MPSFDCRRAPHSIERAICGDTTLSEWDARMGQQYHQALRTRTPAETQSLTDQQRSWIVIRPAILTP
ncbi:lysozyme inhibitor LprI family protein [Bradyrhizobium sp. CCBAU 53380]|uniref:lysozyme inhibitor LprI family protein n=1 Tax=Bradyrhizobium sp. CCBAU 53380 TaxID=1325117 RepID=UPI003FA4937A